MDDTPKVDGTLDEGGADANQNLSAQEPKSIQDVNSLSKQVEALLDAKLKPVLDEVRGVQSRQDKDRNRFQEFLDEYKKQVKKGLTEGEAELAAQKVLDQRADDEEQKQLVKRLAARFLADESPAVASGASEHAKVINSLGLEITDPDVVDLVKKGLNAVDFAIEAAKIVRQKATQPNPTPAQALASQAKNVPQAEATVEAYRKEMLANMGNPTKLRALKEAYREKGVDVDHVIFS